ncbi:AraC family transcriptional regulator [Pedobacter lusitanus]|uniref:AraC family transcriptional regulator n=1 Tax=Pedobacter lusitanus TaxID=1503925 RepID=A0A0D0GGN7_9SPHI|nr:AraC family transcriptional regulator [Pedobacter lusitanus]KIO76447.1 AraC family transcriptional regulator [Pedobacter lusitanus]
MKKIFSKSGEYLLGVKQTDGKDLNTPVQFSSYTVLFVPEGNGVYHADFGSFPFTGPVLLFSTPLQFIHIESAGALKLFMLQFHGDFYCIEYHRAEVSCNGLLFNNIYVAPLVMLSNKEKRVFDHLLNDLAEEFNQESPSEIVLRAYLQLFLAKSSSIKINSIATGEEEPEKDELMEQFRQLLEENYLVLHKPADYARLLAMTPNNLTKRCTRYFRKSPSQLIQERLILEAKKQLHLTRMSIKEIAYSLKFTDEFYFSRVFKKVTKVSPQTFRDQTGISVMADLSK